MNSRSKLLQQPPLRLSEFSDPTTVYDQLQGHGKQGVLTSRTTHEGIEIAGNLPQHSLPRRALLHQTMMSSLEQQQQQTLGGGAAGATDGASKLFDDDELHDILHAANNDASRMTTKLKDNIFLRSMMMKSKNSDEAGKQQQHQHLNQTPTYHHHQSMNQQTDHIKNFHEEKKAGGAEEEEEEANTITPPPKTLGWLHTIIDNFFEFRARQFEIKHTNALLYSLSDLDDKASKMIVPSPISDDVAFHLFEMVSERYGIPSVIAHHCDLILRTAKFYSPRDVSAALFFTLLKTPNFDSNDVRFVVEARKAMRSSLVSQRGVDGVLRWFIPLRMVPYVLRKACEHPWARPVLSKCHSAFEKLLSEQRRHQMMMKNNNTTTTTRSFNSNNDLQNKRTKQSSSSSLPPPLFTLPAANKLILNTPFGNDHPLVGRGPFVDVRGNEQFLGSQPQQLVIGADYLLCMLFCNWLDHRDHCITDVAEGKPIRTIVNRRQGTVASHRTIEGRDELATTAKLQMFAMDIDEKTGEFVDCDFSRTTTKKNRNEKGSILIDEDDKNNDENEENDVDDETNSKREGGGVSSELNLLVDRLKSTSCSSKQLRSSSSSSQQQKRKTTANPNEMVPPRVLHLYTR